MATAPSEPTAESPEPAPVAGTPTAYWLTAAADVLLAALPRVCRSGRRLTKPALMPLLLGRLLADRGDCRPRLVAGTAAALAASWLGDVALLGRSERSFVAGLGAFAAAHVGYVAGFAGVGTRRRAGRSAAVALAVAGTIGPVLATRAPRSLRGPVLGYAGVIGTMLGCALAVDDQQVGTWAARGIRRGAAMFVVSDGLIGTSKFLVPDCGPAVRGALDAAVMATYTWAQAQLTDAVLAAAQHPTPGPGSYPGSWPAPGAAGY